MEGKEFSVGVTNEDFWNRLILLKALEGLALGMV